MFDESYNVKVTDFGACVCVPVTDVLEQPRAVTGAGRHAASPLATPPPTEPRPARLRHPLRPQRPAHVVRAPPLPRMAT